MTEGIGVDKRDDDYRKELIELKKMRAENIEPGSEREKNPEIPSLPVTFSGKVKHYWFYYKYYLLAFIAVAVVTGISIKSCVNRVNPDISVICLTKNAVFENDIKVLEGALAKYAKDYNNNGRVDVTVIAITQNDENPQMNAAMQQKLMAEIAAGESYIYISDDTGLERFSQIGALHDLSGSFDNTVNEGKAVKITLSDILGGEKTVTLPESLYFSMRVYDTADTKKDNKKARNINNSLETFTAILKNHPVLE